MKIHALLLTKDDELIFSDWIERHSGLFSTIAVVDGSTGDSTKAVCDAYSNIRYSRDPSGLITDQTLRHHGYELIRDEVELGDWIFVAHPDEFLIHDPRSFMVIGQNVMFWLPLLILPHPSEKLVWQQTGGQRPAAIFQHYWWRTGQLPHCEERMWRFVKEPEWDIVSTQKSSMVIPINYHNEPHSTLLPLYFHYKCYDLHPGAYNEHGLSTKSNLNTGLPSTVKDVDNKFFDENNCIGEGYESYARRESMESILLQFGNPPQAIVLPDGTMQIVNNAGALIY